MEGQFDAPGSCIKPGTRFGALTFLTWFVNSRHKNHLVFGWRCDTEYYADLYNNLLILATTVRQTHCSKLQPGECTTRRSDGGKLPTRTVRVR